MLPGDPSLEDVKKVVVTERKRPLIPNRWYRDEVMTSGHFHIYFGCWKSLSFQDGSCDFSKLPVFLSNLMHVKIECMVRCTDRVWMLHNYSAWSNTLPKFHKIREFFWLSKYPSEQQITPERGMKRKKAVAKSELFWWATGQSNWADKERLLRWLKCSRVSMKTKLWKLLLQQAIRVPSWIVQWPSDPVKLFIFSSYTWLWNWLIQHFVLFCTVSPDHGQINCGVLGPPSISPADSPESEEISL